MEALAVEARDPITALFLVLGAACDLRSRRIPNRLIVAFTAIALGLNVAADGVAGSLKTAEGFGLGLALLFLPFAAGGIGAGDVKYLAAAGAFLGPVRLWHGFVWGVLLGGLWTLLRRSGDLRALFRRWSLALWTLTTSRSLRPALVFVGRPKERSLPYAVPLAAGLLGVLLAGRHV